MGRGDGRAGLGEGGPSRLLKRRGKSKWSRGGNRRGCRCGGSVLGRSGLENCCFGGYFSCAATGGADKDFLMEHL